MQERFSYEQCQWGQENPERQRRWHEVLERTGPENVRARLAQTTAGSGGTVSIGGNDILIGFAQEWLAWHDRQKAEREAKFRWKQIFWPRWAALVATLVALAAAVGWALTKLGK
jgi:hypothetical protein